MKQSLKFVPLALKMFIGGKSQIIRGSDLCSMKTSKIYNIKKGVRTEKIIIFLFLSLFYNRGDAN